MKILFVMDPGIIIPVKGYGGIERIIEMLALEHIQNGHEVHLLVTTGSSIPGCTVHGFGKEGFPPDKWEARKAIPKAWNFLWKHRNEFDLVHNFGRLVYLLPILNHPVKKIMSYQREITSRNVRLTDTLPNTNMFFTGCSQNLVNRAKLTGEWETVYNGCDFAAYQLQHTIKNDAPLIFLGRIEKIKGCHTAIRVAKATGNNLIIAGNISTLPEEKDYYEKEIAPYIDGKQVRYIGQVNDAQKNEWLGVAKAMLFPIEWEEPFGIVMVESMACGTPVIAFNRGSVNEVIDEAITGFKIDTEQQMIDAVKKLGNISRAQCRHHALERFDAGVIAKQYLAMINDHRQSIVILSTHQPAANPRALKEHETLKELGYKVKHLYAYNKDWSYTIDEEKFKKGVLARQDFIEAGGNPHHQPVVYFFSRVINRIFRTFAGSIPFCKAMSTARPAFALWRAASKYPAQLYIAHYLGALPGALKASLKYKANLIFDAEDFHRGEKPYYTAQTKNVVAVEDSLFRRADTITTASPLITAEYQKYYPQQNIVTVNNVFSKKYLQRGGNEKENTLKLFWFSQHIGYSRGLEIFIQALNYLPDAAISLTIMGNVLSEAYNRKLLALSDHPHRIIYRHTVPPEEIFSIAAGYDIGLAGEVPDCYNKEICLSNKIFSYLLAGNCILVSDMRGQKEFMEQYPGIGFTYQHDDPKDLSLKIKNLYNDRPLLERCKQNARDISGKLLNWENEKEKWLPLIQELLDNEKTSFAGNKKLISSTMAALKIETP